MKVIYRIIAEGQDITSKIADRLIALEITDEAGIQSDSCTLTIDNRDGVISLPRTGAEIDIRLGYEEGGLIPMGIFTVDELELRHPPKTMVIRAKAAKMASALKAEKTRSFDNLTLGALVKSIASIYGYDPKISPDLATIQLDHIDQVAESDLHLLTRLADDFGAVMKLAHKTLLFMPQGESKTAIGKILSPVLITQGMVIDYSYTTTNRGKYGSVEAIWRNTPSNTDNIVAIGHDKPIKRLRRIYPDASTAKKAAKARLLQLTRGKTSLSLKAPGMPHASAEAPLRLSQFHPEIDETPWVISKAVHSLRDSSYQTRLEAKSK